MHERRRLGRRRRVAARTGEKTMSTRGAPTGAHPGAQLASSALLPRSALLVLVALFVFECLVVALRPRLPAVVLVRGPHLVVVMLASCFQLRHDFLQVVINGEVIERFLGAQQVSKHHDLWHSGRAIALRLRTFEILFDELDRLFAGAILL